MVTIPEHVISSLRKGKIREANHLLGFPYEIHGVVIIGNQIGRTLGFPTANLQLSEETQLYIPNGVYAVVARVHGVYYRGITNIGVRPTLGLHQLSIEVNLFDFNQDIYGQSIAVQFIEWLRNEMKFSDLDALKNQIKKDKKIAEELLGLGNHPNSGTH